MAGNNIRDIKRRINGIVSMEHITNAMKLVSAAKLRRAKIAFERGKRNLHYLMEVIEEVFQNTTDVPSHYLKKNEEINKAAYIVVTSCRGLAGSFNSNVIRYTQKLIDDSGRDNTTAVVTAIGSRGRDYFLRHDYEIEKEYCFPPEDISFEETREISDNLLDLYDKGEINEIILVSTKFHTALEQRVFHKTILPLEIEGDPYEKHPFGTDVEYEPSAEEVFNYLIPKYVEITVYNAIIESATCEHAARRMAMENATDNAKEMLEALTLTYNRTRQAAITNEISEIVGGAEALANK